MGYFNYFIKCIIRNIAYKLCKPKVLLTVLMAIAILFVLHSTGYCTWTDGDIEAVHDGLATITSNQGTIISQLSSIGVDVSSIQDDLDYITDTIYTISTTTSNINTKLSTIYQKINELNGNIVNIYNELDANQKELLNKLDTNNQKLITELQKENQSILNELEELKKALNGDSFQDKGVLMNAYSYYLATPTLSNQSSNITISSGTNFAAVTFDYTFKAGYTYNFKYILTGTAPSGGTPIFYTFDKVSVGSTVYANYIGSYTASKTNFSIRFDYDTDLTLLIKYPIHTNTVGNWTITAEKNGSIGNINSSIDQGNQLQQEGNQLQEEQNQLQQEGNQLQEEQNQLQQEQNDLIKDDNVNTDNFEFATNDTNNPTEEGFNTLFTSIYNAFCSTSSKPLTISLPYVNQTFTIQPNLVSNAMQKMRFRSCSNLNTFFLLLRCLSFYI